MDRLIKILKAKITKVKSNSFVLIGSQIVSAILTLVVQVILARELQPAGRGEYALYLLYGSFILLILIQGREYAIRIKLVKREIEYNLAITYLLYFTVISLFSTICLTTLVYYSFPDFSENFISIHTLNAGVLFLFLQLVSVQLTVFLSLKLEYLNSSFASLILEGIKVPLVLIFFRFSNRLDMLFLCLSLSSLISIQFSLRNLRYSIVTDEFKLHLKDLRSFGRQSAVIKIQQFVSANVIIFLLSRYVQISDVGMYSLAFTLVLKGQIVPDAINRHLVPKLKNSELNETFSIVYFWIIRLVIFYSIMYSLLVIFAEEIIVLVFGSEYLPSVRVLKILAAGMFLRMMVKPIEAYLLEYKGELTLLNRLNWATVVLMFSFVFIPDKTIVSAAYFTSIILVAYAFISFLIYLKVSRDCI